MSDNVLILGATSGMARAISRQLAAGGHSLLLAGRNLTELEADAADLRVRHGTNVAVEPFEALDFDGHSAFVDRCFERFGGALDGVVLCYGWMAAQSEAQADVQQARRMIDVNFTSCVSVLNRLADRLEQRQRGYLAVISSVAGDRGRQSNYIYGAAKAGLTAYLSGLRNRLHTSGVNVLTIKPGFVHTRMTAGLLDPGSPLVASPERVARDIERAIRLHRSVLYTPWFWRPIMAIIRSIPEPIFKRLKL
jgi:short-subunit dehydrogenase